MNKLKIVKNKILSLDDLNRWLSYWRFKRNKIVFTNGCFDILHRGHVEYLAQAASLGEVLILGLNTDKSVKNLKGVDRPVQDEKTRALVLAAMQFITAVVLFDEETPYELIKFVQPDVLVKGGDYKIEDIVGADIVQDKGGEIVTIEFVKGYASSKIINKIKQS